MAPLSGDNLRGNAVQSSQTLAPPPKWQPSITKDRARPLFVYLSSLERGIVYLAVFLAPYATLRFSDLFFTVSDLFYCLSLLLLLISGRILLAPLGRATSLWLVAAFLLISGLFGSSLINGDPLRGLIVSAQYLFAYLLLLVILIRKDEREAFRLATIFLASVILIDIHGIVTFYTVGYVPGTIKGVVSGAQRLATVLRNPNLAASINALILPTLLCFWLTGRIKALLAIPMLAVIVTTVILTSSNSGLMAACFSLIVFLGCVMNGRLFFWTILFAGAGAALLYFGGTEMLPPTFQRRVLNALTTGDVSEAGTFVSRVALMQEALAVIAKEELVLTGMGADQFRNLSAQEAPVHNLYLLLWVEGGVFALLGWLLFSGAGLLVVLAARQSGVNRYIVAAMVATIAAYMFIAFSYPHLYARYWMTPVLLSLGFGIAQMRRGRTPAAIVSWTPQTLEAASGGVPGAGNGTPTGLMNNRSV